ncbi:MAG: efflux RND transporter permease subunit [Desulfovibrionaceae bacterium]|nr:efflux RND transporter permease subunit [Desulfovibrionaceae bacterium]
MLKTFITKPILSSVISIFIVIAGMLSIPSLPIELYPNILPPSVSVTTSYPGASPEIISSLVAAPIEEQLNGVDDMIYLQSVASPGQLTTSVYFKTGTDPDMATVNVNNRLQGILTSLPTEVQRQGMTVRKRSSFIMSVIAVTSVSPAYDSIALSNYVNLNILPELKRIPGIGEAQIFGAKLYAMRVWLDPAKMNTLGISPQEVIAAIQAQNQRQPIGIIGAAPLQDPVDLTFAISDVGAPVTVEDFETLIIKALPDGNILYLRDVARVELGSQMYNFDTKYNGKDAANIGIFLAPGANALNVAESINNVLASLSETFPEGIEAQVGFDTTKFISMSIEGVIETFFVAILLVVLVMYLFLQNFRATIIPCLAIPISIIGTFAGLYALGFSLNLFTLFAFILAIGIVVDDAIIVIENVERIMSTEKLSSVPATIKAMKEITGPVIASTLVLCSVFIPISFMGGLAGVMYRQFAITISISVCISSVVALTLTPAMCALLLKPREEKKHFLDFFNILLAKATSAYGNTVAFVLRHSLFGLSLLIIVIVSALWLFTHLPKALVPEEDQGYIISAMIFPDGTSISRTEQSATKYTTAVEANPNIVSNIALIGFDFLTGSPRENYVASFSMLTDWSKRTEKEQAVTAIVKQLAGFAYVNIPDAFTLVLTPPPIPGLSNTGGLQFYLQNRQGKPIQELQATADAFVAKLNALNEVSGARSMLTTNTPQIDLKVNKSKAATLGINISDVYVALQSTIGYLYVNQFVLYDRPFRVFVQADSDFRRLKDAFEQIYVRSNTTGASIPISDVIEVNNTTGVTILERFNTFTAASVMLNTPAGYSSGQTIAAVEQAAKEFLSNEYGIEWVGAAYQEIISQTGTTFILSLSAFFVFLILAALYESITLPIAVMLSVPIGLLGAAFASYFRHLQNDLYFQVAIITLIGLTAKTAILIVEFAVQLREAGATIDNASIEASKLRFRPVLMTMISFILGTIPLCLKQGAGAGSSQSLGTAMVGGMVFYTILGMLLIPFFYKIIMVITYKVTGKKDIGTNLNNSRVM